MNVRRVLRGIAWDWFAGLACLSLVIAPFGCETLGQSEVPTPEDPLVASGMFINESSLEGAILAGRTPTGDSYFVFGARNADGTLADVDSILIRTAAGGESYIVFESGRPVYARGEDGSYASVTYTEVSNTRLAATAELYNAGTAEKTFHNVEIDLSRSAVSVAQDVQDTTGRDLETVTVADASTAKDSRSSVLIGIFSPLFLFMIVPFVSLVGAMTIMLGQVLVAMYAAIAFTLQAVLLIALTPMFLIASLLKNTIVSIELVPFTSYFVAIPDPPAVILF